MKDKISSTCINAHKQPFIYNLELNYLNVNFQFINNLNITFNKMYGLYMYNYYKQS